MRGEAEYLIVGAGAAGCALGWRLRQAGGDVLALELRDADEKDKLCGGALHPRAVKELADLLGREPGSELAFHRVSQVRLRVHSRVRPVSTDVVTLPRRRLDRWLLDHYRQAGGALIDRGQLLAVDEDAHVATYRDLRTGDRHDLSFGTLIGADGAASAVRRIIDGRQQRTITAFEGPAPYLGDDIVSWGLIGDIGFSWYLPQGEAGVIGCAYHDADIKQSRVRLAAFCDALGLPVPELRSALIPKGDDVALKAGKAWLVGDAAGLADAYEGSGIHYALASARRLADALLGGNPYEQAMKPILGEVEQTHEDLRSRCIASGMLTMLKGEVVAGT